MLLFLSIAARYNNLQESRVAGGFQAHDMLFDVSMSVCRGSTCA